MPLQDMELPSHIAQLTGSTEHKVWVMLIERMDALEASIDALNATLQNAVDPLHGVGTEDPLLQIHRLWQFHTSSELADKGGLGDYTRRPWEGQPHHEKLYEVEGDVSGPKMQEKLRQKGIQLYRRRFDLLKCQLSHQTFYGSPEEMPTRAPDKWYVAFTDRIPPKDTVSTWERVV